MSVTLFQLRVYDATRLVPRGKVTTYKLIAEFIGCRCCQAVGQALRRNPFAPAVPCHRVIASDLTLGGFGGAREGGNIKNKEKLLKNEGVRFKNGRLADRSQLFTFDVLR